MIYYSSDGKTRKYTMPITPDYEVETTYVDYKNKHIICFSSMIGCPIKCQFCASGFGGLIRPLTVTEMVVQCQCIISTEGINISNEKPILFSCMGEGEPLANYENVVAALERLSELYPNSKLALSTSGARPDNIKRLADHKFKVPFKLQVSIHSANDTTRKLLIPVSHSLQNILNAVNEYKKSGKGLEFNYVLMHNINDSMEDAEQLAKLAGDVVIKLNVFNPIDGSDIKASMWVNNFTFILSECGAKYEVYKTNGTDIDAACGQLTYKKRKYL